MPLINKRRIFETLEKGEGDDRLSKRFDLFIMTLIILNVAAVILETIERVYLVSPDFFYYFELISIVVFSIEYIARLWTCTYFERYKHPILGRIKFIFSVAGLIDLMAILPFYLPLLFTMDGRILRMLRLFRILRIFKMGRYSSAFNLIIRVINDRKEELLITLTFVLVMLVLASSMMYFIENEAQPENFSSIPETMWWGVATLTTVGYGDVYPITALGKILGAFIAILGVGIFALPAGIIAGGFESEMRKRFEEKSKEKN